MPATSRAERVKGRRRAALAARARHEFDLDIVEVERVVGGHDRRARVWRGVAADGSPWSIKETARDCRFGLALAATLADAGIRRVSAPRRSRDGEPWSMRDGILLSVAPWVEGVDAVEPGAVPVRWHEFGATLRAVHEAPPPTVRPIRRGIRRTEQRPAALLAAVDDRVDDPLGPASSAAFDSTITRIWREHRSRLDALVRLERELKRHRAPTTRVPLHGDPHLGNVIVDGAGHPWLIDFDEATTAPREVDLMLVELGVIFSSPMTEAQRRSFRAGYGSDAAVDESRILRFGCVRAVEDVAATMHRLLDAPPDRRAPELAFLDGLLGPHGLTALIERRLGGAASPTGTPTPPAERNEGRP